MGDLTREEMYNEIKAAHTWQEWREYRGKGGQWKDEGWGYNGAAFSLARIMLEFIEDHPEFADVPMDPTFDFNKRKGERGYYKTIGIGELMKAFGEEAYWSKDIDDYLGGVTGFMWGWAYNAVRYALNQDEKAEPNPAIIEVTIG
jgi:hypothetical protein